MLIYQDESLIKYKKDNLQIDAQWHQRDFVTCVKNYVDSSTEKVMAVSGLRGTGKTVGILQATEGNDILYISAQEGERETAEDYIDVIDKTEKHVIVIDEYSWIKDREKLDKHLMTPIQNNKRIIITATESITLEFLNYGDLMHRVQPIHTTMFTYEEYLRLYDKEQSKETCKEFLMEGGLFKDYIIKNFESARQYINNAIVNNLAGYLKNEMDSDKAKTLTYSVLYKAICPSNLASVPVLRNNHTTLENFLEQMGVNTDYIPEERLVNRVADIFEQAGIIVRIPNYNKNSELKEQYYITNPSLTCQLIKETYSLSDIENTILGHVFEGTCAIQLANNILSEHKLYFYNNGSEQNNAENKELDLVIIDRSEEFAYFFECKFKQNDSIKQTQTLRSGYLEEHEFQDMEILGRYVIYNGNPSVHEYEVGKVIFTPIGGILDKYFEFDHNVSAIENKKSEKKKDIMVDSDSGTGKTKIVAVNDVIEILKDKHQTIVLENISPQDNYPCGQDHDDIDRKG